MARLGGLQLTAPSCATHSVPSARSSYVGLTLFAGLFLGLATVVSASAKGRDQYAGLDALAKALATIQQSYVEQTDAALWCRHAIAGLVAGLDAHSVWLDPDRVRGDEEPHGGRRRGVGLVLTSTPPACW
jgi:hypothetical protein